MRFSADEAQVLGIFILLLGVSGLAYWIYNAWYKARINKALEEGRPVAPTPELGKVILFLAAVACVLGFAVWANHLQTRITQLENAIHSDASNLSYRIDEHYMSLMDELRAENAVFEVFDYEISGTDTDRRTLSVKVSALPKEAAPDAAVYLRFGDQALALEKSAGGIWTGEAVLAFRDALRTESAYLSIVEEGRERNQQVDFSLAGWQWAHFPKVIATPDYLYRDLKTEGKVGLTADISFTVTPSEWIRAFSAVVQIDGEDVLEQDLLGSLQKKNGDYADDSVRLEGQFDAREDSVMTLLLRFTDDLGFLHEYTLISYPDGIRGDPRGDQSESVYDTDGTLLFTDP